MYVRRICDVMHSYIGVGNCVCVLVCEWGWYYAGGTYTVIKFYYAWTIL